MVTGSVNNKFSYIGGNSAIDFANTVGGWAHRPSTDGRIGYRDVEVREKLEKYDDLLAWGLGAGMISESESRNLAVLAYRLPRAADDVLDRAVRLRRAIYRLLISPEPNRASFASDVSVLNQELSLARAQQVLLPQGTEFELGWHSLEALDRVLWPVAVAAASLLTSGQRAKLRQCRGEACGWLFLDLSRNHSRTWCTMKDCGNVAKVRRFRQRQKPDA
jgi:predicted RNA-binding Zn ribbon-like protein